MKKLYVNKIFIFFVAILSVAIFLCAKTEIVDLAKEIIQTQPEKLNSGRAAWDKLKVKNVRIASRTTGTAPFDSGSPSLYNGLDSSPNDNYVRTLDTVTYNLEVNIGQNGNNGSYTGAVIKVKAKLPNQTSGAYMIWEKSAWMNYNSSISVDGTELTAEYHFPDSASISNATQTLSFNVRMGGDRKNIVSNSNMQPEFEVWMEGNKPDNASSKAPSLRIKDNRQLIITGVAKKLHISNVPSDNASTVKGSKYIDGKWVSGNYVTFNYGIDYTVKEKGTVLWGPDIELELKLTYEEVGVPSAPFFNEVTSSKSSNSINRVNGIVYVASTFEGNENNDFYPSKYNVGDTQTAINRFQDGTVSATQNQNIVKLKFHANLKRRTETIRYSLGKSGSGYDTYVQIFVPYTSGATDYRARAVIQNVKFNLRDEGYQSVSTNDGYTTDSRVDLPTHIATFSKKLIPIRSAFYNGHSDPDDVPKNRVSDEKAAVLGTKIYPTAVIYADDGRYNGGMDTIFLWRSDYMELEKPTRNYFRDGYDKTGYVLLEEKPKYIYGPLMNDSLNVTFGVYRNRPNGGLLTDNEVNKATISDFTWYSSYNSAKQAGTVAALDIRDPKYFGNAQRGYTISLRTKNIYSHIGDVVPVISKSRGLGNSDSWFTNKDAYYTDDYYGEQPIKKDVYQNGKYTNNGGKKKQYIITSSLANSPIKTSKEYSYSDFSISEEYTNPDVGINIREGFVKFQIKPIKRSMEENTSNNIVSPTTTITATLPKGLTYQDGSSNKPVKSTYRKADGTTDIVWEYKNWKNDTPAPEYPEITFNAIIDPSLPNETKLVLAVKTDDSLYDYINEQEIYKKRIRIANLPGTYVSKSINKLAIDKNESFIVSTIIGNSGGKNSLSNVRTLDILPKSGYSGSYNIYVKKLIPNQRLYYTTNSIASSGITNYGGQYSVKNINFGSDSRWHEVRVGGSVPYNTTAIATVTSTVPPNSSNEFSYNVYPSNNLPSNTYNFKTTLSTSNLTDILSSNESSITVTNRYIEGKIFLDTNKNNLFDSKDGKVNDIKINLLNENKQLVKSQTIRNSNYYNFSGLDKGKYYVQVELPGGYKVIAKGTNSDSNKMNTNGISDLITVHQYAPTSKSIGLTNYHIGLYSSNVKLTVHHYIKGTKTPVIANSSKTYTIKAGGTYNTNQLDVSKTDYVYSSVVGSKSGTINADTTVIYYYELKKGTVKVHHYIENSTTELMPTETITKDYRSSYETKPKLKNDNYEVINATPSNYKGTISSPNIEVIYYYRLKDSNLKVYHYIENTTTEVAPNSNKVFNKKFGESYSISPIDTTNLNYEVINKPNNASGTINNKEIIVTYYYRLKKAKVTINHFIEGTTNEVVKGSNKVLNKHWGETYKGERLDTSKLDYEFSRLIGTEEGTLKGDVTITYYYKLKKGNLIVHHYIKDTTTSLVADETSTLDYKTNYKTNVSKDINENYQLVKMPTNSSGTIKDPETIVTYYYELKKAKIITKHLETKTDKELAISEEQIIEYTKNYKTNISTKIPNNYEFLSKTDNFEGIVSTSLVKNGIIEVIYYYQKKDTNINSDVSVKGNEEISKTNEPINYVIDYKASLKDYIGDATITLVDKLPYPIDETKSTLDGGTYNKDNLTITWEIPWTKIDTYKNNNEQSTTVTKNIKILYLNINPLNPNMNNNIEAKLKLDTKEHANNNDSNTIVKIKGDIIIHHYLEGTTEKIAEDTKTTGIYNENYILKPIENPAYEVVKKPESENITYKEETQEFIYEYKKVTLNVETKVEGIGGTITGGETLYYGETTTKDIVISPDEGYEIDKIYINDSIYNLKEEEIKSLILNPLTNVKENTIIKVIFKEKVMENPNTSSIIFKYVLYTLLILIIPIILIIKKIKPKFNKI